MGRLCRLDCIWGGGKLHMETVGKQDMIYWVVCTGSLRYVYESMHDCKEHFFASFF